MRWGNSISWATSQSSSFVTWRNSHRVTSNYYWHFSDKFPSILWCSWIGCFFRHRFRTFRRTSSIWWFHLPSHACNRVRRSRHAVIRGELPSSISILQLGLNCLIGLPCSLKSTMIGFSTLWNTSTTYSSLLLTPPKTARLTRLSAFLAKTWRRAETIGYTRFSICWPASEYKHFPSPT